MSGTRRESTQQLGRPEDCECNHMMKPHASPEHGHELPPIGSTPPLLRRPSGLKRVVAQGCPHPKALASVVNTNGGTGCRGTLFARLEYNGTISDPGEPRLDRHLLVILVRLRIPTGEQMNPQRTEMNLSPRNSKHCCSNETQQPKPLLHWSRQLRQEL
ncbi:hypothetical protein NDU88_006800 [Pleurodeles waltl]|uniref:Uncharacterized protein n=1 Tax=Pleurodeles waltl TaxID=8319 RepID=A0AAV7VQP5_PLEWA|nr:hypothetical protein NDU88_006800 [Pleurodeles waltl]